ncbi:hypothetical protein [Luethyella okanaganae]|uniref:Uncharacterized protein n=1 Tax=Luethyella okanaganae TaxID=69372 RepID=A0ABW1VCG4_9MICO
MTLKPHGHLFRQGSLATLALLAPVFAVLYWLAIPYGIWMSVLVAQLVLMALYGLTVVAYMRVYIRVDNSGVEERGFFGRINRVPVDRVDSILIADLYQGGTLDTHPQLFAIDENGRLLLRMRGRYWPQAAMDVVAETLGAPVTYSATPTTLAEFTRVHPELLYWFERRPLWGRNETRPPRP